MTGVETLACRMAVFLLLCKRHWVVGTGWYRCADTVEPTYTKVITSVVVKFRCRDDLVTIICRRTIVLLLVLQLSHACRDQTPFDGANRRVR